MQACDVNNADPGATSQQSEYGQTSARSMDCAGTVIATGDRVTRFAAGDEVFGHFPAESWAWDEPPCVRIPADGPHVELRPECLEPLAAAALAHNGLTAKTILRATEPKADQTALVIGATSGPGRALMSLLAETGAQVIDAATDTSEDATGDPTTDALRSHPDLDLLVDCDSWGEPYFITAAARGGTIVSALPRPDGPGVPRIGIAAEPGDLAELAQRALVEHQPVDIAHVQPLERSA